MTENELELRILRAAKERVLNQPIEIAFICPCIDSICRITVGGRWVRPFLVAEVKEFINGSYTLGHHIPVSNEMQLTFRIAILDTMIARRINRETT